MSKLIVEVCQVEEIAVHPNADRLERLRIKNWWVCEGKGKYQVGDKVVYVPPDASLPTSLSDKWGITKYCSPIKGEDRVRVRAARLRSVASFGTVQPVENADWPVGMDLVEHYGITKYEPPLKALDGDAASPVPEFHAYTSIENLGNYPNVLVDGEEVIVTEKIHGTNSRVGIVFTNDAQWEPMAGSHGTRRKQFNDKEQRSKFWFPFGEDVGDGPMMRMLMRIALEQSAQTSVIVFGEIFGASIQDMTYGQKGLSYRAFDIAVDGNYLDDDTTATYLREFGISMVPLLYRGPYSLAKMDELVDGPTTVCDVSAIKEAFKGREGIVIKPVKERFDGVLGGRAILKYISADYHDRKNANRTEDH